MCALFDLKSLKQTMNYGKSLEKHGKLEKHWKLAKTTYLTINTPIFALNETPNLKQPFPKQEKTSNAR
jgi:hypothetical protein